MPLCAGSKVLCKNCTLTVGENTVIAANPVLLSSMGDHENMGGKPNKIYQI